MGDYSLESNFGGRALQSISLMESTPSHLTLHNGTSISNITHALSIKVSFDSEVQ